MEGIEVPHNDTVQNVFGVGEEKLFIILLNVGVPFLGEGLGMLPLQRDLTDSIVGGGID